MNCPSQQICTYFLIFRIGIFKFEIPIQDKEIAYKWMTVSGKYIILNTMKIPIIHSILFEQTQNF